MNYFDEIVKAIENVKGVLANPKDTETWRRVYDQVMTNLDKVRTKEKADRPKRDAEKKRKACKRK